MKKSLYFIFIAGFLLFSCKKKTIVKLPESNDPVFYLDGTFGNKTLTCSAGEDGMVMNHGVEVRNGVKYAFGEMTNGNVSIKLGVLDGNVALQHIFGTLKAGDSLSVTSKFSEDLANLSKGNFSNDENISNIDWYINGVLKGSNQLIIDQPGIYDVCAIFTFNDNFTKQVCNRMYLGFQEEVDFSIKHFLSENGDVKLWVEGETQYFDSVVWEIENEVLGSATSISTSIGNTVKEISAKVYHKNGAVRKKNIVIDGTFNGHFIEDFDVCEIPVTQKKWDYSVGLELNMNGKKYSSFETSNFKSKVLVNDVQFHQINAQGDQIVRLTVEVDAIVKCGTTGESSPIKFSGVFAYPQDK